MIRTFYKCAIIATSLTLGGCYAGEGSPSSEQYVAGYTPDELRELTPAEKAVLEKAFVKALKDPDSAKIAWTKVPKVFPATASFDYCATLNAKNSYGGYVGYAPFMGSIAVANGKITGGSIKILADSDVAIQAMVTDQCAKKGLDPAPRT